MILLQWGFRKAIRKWFPLKTKHALNCYKLFSTWILVFCSELGHKSCLGKKLTTNMENEWESVESICFLIMLEGFPMCQNRITVEKNISFSDVLLTYFNLQNILGVLTHFWPNNSRDSKFILCFLSYVTLKFALHFHFMRIYFLYFFFIDGPTWV